MFVVYRADVRSSQKRHEWNVSHFAEDFDIFHCVFSAYLGKHYLPNIVFQWTTCVLESYALFLYAFTLLGFGIRSLIDL